MIDQDLALCPSLSILDNLFLGRPIHQQNLLGKYLKLLDKPLMHKTALTQIKRQGVSSITYLNLPVKSLSGGQRQAIAIMRSVLFPRQFIIMDEPTAALGLKESIKVLELMTQMKSQCLSIIFISHNLPQIFKITDRIHIHRYGKRLCFIKPNNTLITQVIALMTGAEAPSHN